MYFVLEEVSFEKGKGLPRLFTMVPIRAFPMKLKANLSVMEHVDMFQSYHMNMLQVNT